MANVHFDDVAPIFERHCIGCHREGGPAPFALGTWEQARAWSSAIRRAVAGGVMPPWHADPRYGEFANDRRLLPADEAAILAWVDAGSQRGPVSDAKEAEPAVAPRVTWRIGEPDLIYELPVDVTVPAAGAVPYHGYRVPTHLAEDVWIQAAETRPGNPAVVHHVIVQAFSASGPGAGWVQADSGDPRTAGDLGGYAPGTGPLVMPQGVGRRLPAGAVLDFQMHYTPNGRVETDRTRIGLVLARERPRYESKTALCSTPFLWLPAGEKGTRFEAELRFPRSSRILSLRPHMHLRGDTFEFRVEYPDTRSEILLRVEDYDFDWQTTYEFAEPKAMPAGTRLVCVATYDNSRGNPDNPDPTRNVSWGRGTTDEMMIGFVNYYEVEQ